MPGCSSALSKSFYKTKLLSQKNRQKKGFYKNNYKSQKIINK